jgi:transposase
LALRLGDELKDLDERIAIFLAQADPRGIMTSVPGVGAILGAQILGRLGDPHRFRTLAGVRSFSGLVPSLDSSGTSGRHGGPMQRCR